MAPALSFRSRCASAALLLALPLWSGAAETIEADPVTVSETPLTASATGFTEFLMAESSPLASRSLSAVTDAIANVHVSDSGAGSFGSLYSLRGLTNTPYFSDPSVIAYFDDLPLGSAFTFPTELFGFSSATVLRGPQPAAFGRVAEGGVIKFSSSEPGTEPTGELRAGFGNFNTRIAAVHARSARTRTVDATVSASVTERDGYVENSELGTPVDEQRHATAAARLRVRPAPRAEIGLQVLLQRRRDGAQPLVPIGGPWLSVVRGREGKAGSDFAGAALKLAFDTDIGSLTATTSRTSWRLDPFTNRLVLPPPLDSQLAQTQRAWNQELRLASAPSSALTWHVGVWLSHTRTAGDVRREIPGLLPIEASSFTLSSRTAALFGETTFATESGWKLNAAARVERVRKAFDRTQTIPGPAGYDARRTFDALLPKLSASRALGAGANATLSAGLGWKPGGWSAYTDEPMLARFRPEKATAFEAAVDALLAGRSLKLTARIFHYRIRDYHIERSFNATDYLVVNAPRARSTGGELEIAWRPARGWTVTGGTGVTRATLSKFTDPFTGRSYRGRRAPYTPDFDAHIRVERRFASGWFAAAALTAAGRTFFEESEDPLASSASREVIAAEAGYDASRWRVGAWMQNIADVRYATLVIPGVGHKVPGAPRTYGIEAAVKW